MTAIATNAAVAGMGVATHATVVTGADAARAAVNVAPVTKDAANTVLTVHRARATLHVATNLVATSRTVRRRNSHVVTKVREADVATVVRAAKAAHATASHVVTAARRASASRSKRVLRVSPANRGRRVNTASRRKRVSRSQLPLQWSQPLQAT